MVSTECIEAFTLDSDKNVVMTKKVIVLGSWRELEDLHKTLSEYLAKREQDSATFVVSKGESIEYRLIDV